MFWLTHFSKDGTIVGEFSHGCLPSHQAFPSIPSGMILAGAHQRYLHGFGRWDKGSGGVSGKSFSHHIDGPDRPGRWA